MRNANYNVRQESLFPRRVFQSVLVRMSAYGTATGLGQFSAIQSVAPSVGVEVNAVSVRDAGEIERAITIFARSSNGDLIVTGSALAVLHRDLIIALAARHKLPSLSTSNGPSSPAAA